MIKNFTQPLGLLFAGVIAVSSFSCKKHNDAGDQGSSGTSVLQFKVNGALKTYSLGSADTNGSKAYWHFQGSQAADKTSNSFDGIVNTDSPIAVNEVCTNPDYIVNLKYKDEAGKLYSAYTGTTRTVILTAISSDRLKGTFKGSLKSADGIVVEITEGSFDVPM